MKLAIMQPYFLPYIGYFQLLSAVDTFVVYDNIKYTKKGWINRNRMLVDGKSKMFTVPIKKDSDHLHVVQRELADNFDDESEKTLRRIEAAYQKAPFYGSVMPVVRECFQRGSGNLFDFIYASLISVVQFLEIDTEIVVSSSIDVDHSLKAQDKVLAICENLEADVYVNSIGGLPLYNAPDFRDRGICLLFMETELVKLKYEQFGSKFVPWLSIVDVMMFNSKGRIRECLHDYYSLIGGY